MPNDESKKFRVPLSAQLRLLAREFSGRPVSLKEALESIQGRGHALVLVLISLPFLTPIPIPMLSSLFGTAMAIIGLRLALGQHPHLPRKLMEKKLPATWLPKLLNASSRIISVLEWVVKPRLEWVHDNPVLRRIGGLLIMISGVQLLLPLPVPFSNFFPAAAALLLASSEIGRDGLVYMAGVLMFAVSSSFFVLLALGGKTALTQVFGQIGF